jgi:two-component system cell cycle response regulator
VTDSSRKPGTGPSQASRDSSVQRTGDATLALPSGDFQVPDLAREHAGLLVIQGQEIGREYRLRRNESILGRDEGAALRIPDERVSRRHASLEVDRDLSGRVRRTFIRDLGSTNGTYVNGEAVGRRELREGDKVRVGDTVLRFMFQDALDSLFHREIRNRIAYDQLTGLLTKESLYAALEAELRRCARYGLPLAVLMMDLDRFKSVNDTHGHLMGSHVLSEVGRLIRVGFRRTDVAARYGGEEFLAYLSEESARGALPAAERVRGAIEDHPFRRTDEAGRSTSVRVSISIGISEFPRNGRSLEALVEAADRALYRAKEEGRNRVRSA